MGQIIGYIIFTIIAAVFGAKWFIEKDGHPKALLSVFCRNVEDLVSVNESITSFIYY